MSSHTCRPDHEGLLADGCPRCDEHAADPFLLTVDDEKLAALWQRMLEVEFGGRDTHRHISRRGHYETDNEEKACRNLYRLGLWLERNTSLRPWVPLADLRVTPA